MLGIINLDNFERENAYGETEVRLLTTIAGSLGTALENARLFDETQRLLEETSQRSNELAILNSVSEEMAKTLDVKTITRIVGDKVHEIFETDAAFIFLLDAETNLIHCYYGFDKGEGGYVEDLVPFPIGTGLSSKVILSRQPLLLGSIEEQIANGAYYDEENLEQSSGVKTQSWLGVPIIVGDKVLGVVHLSDYRPAAYNQDHLRLLQTLASNMGVAIANARQFEAEAERVAELQVINTIQQGLAAELDFQAIVDLVGDKLREVFSAPDLAIAWYDNQSKMGHSLYIFDHGERVYEPPGPLLPDGVHAKLSKSRHPLVWGTVEEGKAIAPTAPGTDASKSGVMVPIISSDLLIGCITVENYEQEHAYGESQLRLLTTVAGTLGAALENAHLFEETQRLLEETRQRNNELAILNSIQQGLASKLDFQSIVDLVGDNLRQIFNVNDIGIAWYDEKANLSTNLYTYEHGQRLTIHPAQPLPGGLFETMVKNRQPIIYNTTEDHSEINIALVPGTDPSKSSYLCSHHQQ